LKSAIALVLLAATPALADPPARCPDIRFALAAGKGTNQRDASGTALGGFFDAGWWASKDFTFGVHVGLAGFEVEDGPDLITSSYFQTHATLLLHANQFVAGAGIGLDIAHQLFEGGPTGFQARFGAHLQVGLDLVRAGPGSLGAFAIVTGQPIPIELESDHYSDHDSVTILVGLSYALVR